MKRSFVEQFLMDGLETKGSKMNVDGILNLFIKYSHYIKVGNVLVTANFSEKGGSIEIRKMVELKGREWEGYGDYLDTVSLETAILIEHPDYLSKNVQPFDRQEPFYIGYRFANLNKAEIEGWTVYCSEEHRSNITFCPKKFHYNNFWDTVSFTIPLKEEDLNLFLQEFLTAANVPEKIAQTISKM
jgi:hypothetical protein